MSGLLAGVRESLLAFDLELFRAINARHAPWADALLRVGTELGQGWVLGLLLLGGILALLPRASWRRAVALGTAAMLASSLASNLIKRLAGRLRPDRAFEGLAGAGEAFKVHVVAPLAGPALHYNSFPSGHASAAFCAATVAVLLFGRRAAWAYPAAAAIAWSRVYVGVHFPLDVLAGAAIGTAVGLAVGLPLTRAARRAPAP